MIEKPFKLTDGLLALDGDQRAAWVEKSHTAVRAAGAVRVLGMTAFCDDDSVHADYWEIHPAGDEILYVMEGRLLAFVASGDAVLEAVVEPGHALVVPQAHWHRLRVLEPGRLLFLTPTAGTGLRAATPDGALPDDAADLPPTAEVRV